MFILRYFMVSNGYLVRKITLTVSAVFAWPDPAGGVPGSKCNPIMNAIVDALFAYTAALFLSPHPVCLRLISTKL